ncbi:MAG: glycosyltransferase family 2 protein [Fimbriimonadaceae bacterium]
MPKVSVIVVSYNTREHLRNCLNTIEPHHEVIVVDNASTDGSPDVVEQEYPHVKLVRNSQNRGFGAANNQGLDVMTGDLALFLNSDAQPLPGAIDALAAVFEDPKVVAAGGHLGSVDDEGAWVTQPSSCHELTLWAVFCEQTLLEKALRNSKTLSPYWNTRWLLANGSEPQATEQVMGACLMTRPVERFDERFFLYTEDTEYCRRLRRHGAILYVPQAKFHHALGASTARTRGWAVGMYNRGKELYFELHHGRVFAAICLMLNRLGALLRVLLWGGPAVVTLGLVPRFRLQTAMFARVLTYPHLGPPLPPDSGR